MQSHAQLPRGGPSLLEGVSASGDWVPEVFSVSHGNLLISWTKSATFVYRLIVCATIRCGNRVC